MRRVALVLQRSGLSIGDGLNVALFLLSVIALVVAILSLWIARITLDEARRSSSEQQSQFVKQIADLDGSTQSLNASRDLLEHTQKILQTNVDIARNQLTDLDNAERRERKRELAVPFPMVSMYCGGKEVIHFEDSINTENQYSIPVKDGKIDCYVYVKNDGTGPMQEMILEARVYPSETKIVTVNDRELPLGVPTNKVLLNKLDILPTFDAADREDITSFTLKVTDDLRNFELLISIKGVNYRGVTRGTAIKPITRDH